MGLSSGIVPGEERRARDTARLLAVGKVRAYPALDSSFTVSDATASRRTAKVRSLIDRHRGKRGVLVLVGHQVNITDLTGVAPPSGGAVVVKADPNGSIRVVGSLKESGIEAESVSLARPTLDDVFLGIVERKGDR